MNNTVWKFQLELDQESVSIPYGAKLLHVGMQDGMITLWALVDPTRRLEIRRFTVVDTGHPAPSEAEASHVGTVVDEPFVWHVFESIGA